MKVEFTTIAWGGRAIRIEHAWIDRAHSDAPLMVFLHEGLGSLAMWKDFPQRLCAALGCRGLVYSRPGYGSSTPRDSDEAWDVDFMHRQAHGMGGGGAEQFGQRLSVGDQRLVLDVQLAHGSLIGRTPGIILP